MEASRTGDEAEGSGGRDSVDRYPEGDVLRALDVIVRLVLVVGRGLRGERLLDQQVVVVEPHLPDTEDTPWRGTLSSGGGASGDERGGRGGGRWSWS